MSIRDNILKEYRAEGFDCSTKAGQYEDGKTYYPIVELEKFFYADNPGGQIVCEIHTMNNSYAVVTATLIGTDNKIWKANGYYAHTNADVWGINYLGTAQVNALRAVLNIWFAQKGNYEEPAPSYAPEFFAPSESDFPPQTDLFNKRNGMTLDQAKSFVITSMGNRTIGEIMEKNDPDEIVQLRDKLRFEYEMNTKLAEVAEIILPYIS